MNTLKLTIKKEYFDMILLGDKTEEYRKIKKHWFDRLVFLKEKVSNYFGLDKLKTDAFDFQLNELIKIKFRRSMIAFIPFDQVEFTNGYNSTSPKAIFECKGIEIRTGKPDWGAEPDKLYFVIKLGKEISRENCKQ